MLTVLSSIFTFTHHLIFIVLTDAAYILETRIQAVQSLLVFVVISINSGLFPHDYFQMTRLQIHCFFSL